VKAGILIILVTTLNCWFQGPFLLFSITIVIIRKSTDRCLEPMSEGTCSDYVLLWYFHDPSGACRPFVYSGCGGNQNQFPSKQECQALCGTTGRGSQSQSDPTGQIPSHS
uniref:BPTI/Kunitz inhibitor domain-containing protein n=1 Tax=Gouania willdenowi TaxID=441366 RepID=A0A8C5EKF4_GOUWI